METLYVIGQLVLTIAFWPAVIMIPVMGFIFLGCWVEPKKNHHAHH